MLSLFLSIVFKFVFFAMFLALAIALVVSAIVTNVDNRTNALPECFINPEWAVLPSHNCLQEVIDVLINSFVPHKVFLAKFLIQPRIFDPNFWLIAGLYFGKFLQKPIKSGQASWVARATPVAAQQYDDIIFAVFVVATVLWIIGEVSLIESGKFSPRPSFFAILSKSFLSSKSFLKNYLLSNTFRCCQRISILASSPAPFGKL